MYIRLAEDADLPQLASIGAAAFASDPIYEHFYPFRHIYPQDFYNAILNSLRRLMVTPGGMILVAELAGSELSGAKTVENKHTQEESHGAELLQRKKIVAYFTLVRHGKEESVAAWNPDSNEKREVKQQERISVLVLMLFSNLKLTNSEGLHRQLLDIEQAKFRDRSASPEVMLRFYEIEQRLIGRVKEWIDYRTLAVLPEFQRTGIGKMLFVYALSRADAEKVPAYMDASKKGISLYLRMGCEVIGHIKLDARVVHLSNDSEQISPSRAAENERLDSIRLDEIEVPVLVYNARFRSAVEKL